MPQKTVVKKKRKKTKISCPEDIIQKFGFPFIIRMPLKKLGFQYEMYNDVDLSVGTCRMLVIIIVRRQ